MKPLSRPSRTPSKFSNSCGFLFVACLFLSGVSNAAPYITLSKKTGPPTSQILVSGRGFEPNVGVDIYFDTKDEALIVTDAKGEFRNARAYAPRSARPGQHWVTALERNNDKGAQKPFLVQTNWRNFRFSPAREGANPYENVLDPHTIDGLVVRWTYDTKNSFTWGSPDVVDGTAYVSTGFGLFALDAKTGVLRWKFPMPGSDLLTSNPAIANGMVYVGTQDLGVYAIDTETGKLVWKSNCDGAFCEVSGSPAVVNGVVYFDNASQDREHDGLYAVDAKTGKGLWFFNPNCQFCPSSSSPAVANGVVYFGGGDYQIYAIDARTGTKLWSYATNFYVESSAAVANGVVYIGSDDKNLYALNASTGNKLWSYATGGQIDSSPAVANGVVYITSYDQSLYALNAYTGALVWSYPIGAYYLSNASVANGVVYVGTGDLQPPSGGVYAFNAATGALLWSYAASSYVFPDPTIVNGMVYFDTYQDGIIYGFALADKADAEQEAVSGRPEFKALRPDLRLKLSRNPNTVRR
jgi:outer membrane protein assembly factor BamB